MHRTVSVQTHHQGTGGPREPRRRHCISSRRPVCSDSAYRCANPVLRLTDREAWSVIHSHQQTLHPWVLRFLFRANGKKLFFNAIRQADQFDAAVMMGTSPLHTWATRINYLSTSSSIRRIRASAPPADAVDSRYLPATSTVGVRSIPTRRKMSAPAAVRRCTASESYRLLRRPTA